MSACHWWLLSFGVVPELVEASVACALSTSIHFASTIARPAYISLTSATSCSCDTSLAFGYCFSDIVLVSAAQGIVGDEPYTEAGDFEGSWCCEQRAAEFGRGTIITMLNSDCKG